VIKVVISGKSADQIASHIAELHNKLSNSVVPTASANASSPKPHSDAAESESSKTPQQVETSLTPQRKRGRPPTAATLAKRAKAEEKKHGILASELEAEEEEKPVYKNPKEESEEVEETEETEEAEDVPAEPDISIDDVKVVINDAAKILTAKVLLPKAKVLLERYKAESVAALKAEDRAGFIRGIQEMVTRSESHKK
jgi:hypothetical protein